MKPLLPIVFWLLPIASTGQTKEVSALSRDTTQASVKNQIKPEILCSGFIDIVNNGQVNASARFIRLFIGEPGKFALPLSIYSGVSSNNFQNQSGPGGSQTNDHLVNTFINPLGGLANISIDGILFFNKVQTTGAGFLYHTGIRILTGYKTGPATEPSTGKPVNFLNNFGSPGLYFQTGAWEKNNSRNVGIFWLAGRYIFCKTKGRQLEELLPGIATNGFYHGWSLAGGVEINGLVNIKIIFYKYVKEPEVDYGTPIYQFSFNYSLR